MAIKHDKVGIVFNRIHYNVNDIERIWYNFNDKKLIFNLYNNSEEYGVSMSESRANLYINAVNEHRFINIIRFDDKK